MESELLDSVIGVVFVWFLLSSVLSVVGEVRFHFAFRSEVTSRWASPSLQERYGFESMFPSGADGGIAMEIVAPAPRSAS